MSMNLAIALNFETTTCYSCSCLIALERDFMANRRRDHQSFYCPNGHSQHFLSETIEEKLKKELAEEQRRVAFEKNQRAAAERQLEAAQKDAERLRKRAQNGVCPCCKRSFPNLRRHMKSRHPEVAPK